MEIEPRHSFNNLIILAANVSRPFTKYAMLCGNKIILILKKKKKKKRIGDVNCEIGLPT